jgi:glycosyltransferase involved in cell wall biosynthesis
MKLLILNYEYPPLGGGAGVITQIIAEGFAARGHNITVLTTWFSGEEEDSTRGNLRIIRLKSKRKVVYKSNPIEMLSWMKQK